jgi:hypothetical protein
MLLQVTLLDYPLECSQLSYFDPLIRNSILTIPLGVALNSMTN